MDRLLIVGHTHLSVNTMQSFEENVKLSLRWVRLTEGGGGGLDPPGKLQVAKGFLEIFVRTPLRSNWTLRVQLLLEGGLYDTL